MTMQELLQQERKNILRIAAEHGAQNVRIFGSVIREDDNDESDIDILVSMEMGRSLLDLIGLNNALEDLLDRKVDVIDDEGLSPYIRNRILSEAVAL